MCRFDRKRCRIEKNFGQILTDSPCSHPRYQEWFSGSRIGRLNLGCSRINEKNQMLITIMATNLVWMNVKLTRNQTLDCWFWRNELIFWCDQMCLCLRPGFCSDMQGLTGIGWKGTKVRKCCPFPVKAYIFRKNVNLNPAHWHWKDRISFHFEQLWIICTEGK